MYSDLYEGIVEIFSEAQRLGEPGRAWRPRFSADELRRFQRQDRRRVVVRRSQIATQKRWRQRVDTELRAKRPRYMIVPIVMPVAEVHQGETLSRVCASCGCVEELRPGLNRWQHITRSSVCWGPR